MGVQPLASWTYCVLAWPSSPCVGWRASYKPFYASTLVSRTRSSSLSIKLRVASAPCSASNTNKVMCKNVQTSCKHKNTIYTCIKRLMFIPTESRDRCSPIEDKGEPYLPLSPRRWSDECELYNKLESWGEVDNLRLSFGTPTLEECDDLLRFCLKGFSLSIWYDIYKFTQISAHNIFKFYMLIPQIQRPSY